VNLYETVVWFRARGEPPLRSVLLAIGYRALILAEREAARPDAATGEGPA